MNEIKVIIAGRVKTGKSTIANIISAALSDHGIDSVVTNPDGDVFVDPEKQRKRADRVRESVRVTISEEQLNREGISRG